MQQTSIPLGTLCRTDTGFIRVPRLIEELACHDLTVVKHRDRHISIPHSPLFPNSRMVIINLQAPDGTAVEFTPSHSEDDELTIKKEPNSSWVTISFRDADGTLCRFSFEWKLVTNLDTTA